MKFAVLLGQTPDALEMGCRLLSKRGSQMFKVLLLMGCAYEGDENEVGSFFFDWKSGKGSWEYERGIV